ncbi:MAG: DMT family protein, partial [Muribaculaceae bacterium]|nr:DMT family protein [Muribaculaceae bacterium]
MKSALLTIGLLIISNVFMTMAWYGHLKMQSLGWTKSWP